MYIDILQLRMTKIVDCQTIKIVLIYRKYDNNFMKSKQKGNLTLTIIDNYVVPS